MDPDFRSPVSPGTPLFPLSSERANARKRPPPDSQQQTDSMTHQLSPSPSLSALPHLLQNRGGHLRGASDVQGKVAQFNGLAKEAAQRRKDSEAALRRAIVGREEAEAESKRLRDSNEILRREIEGGRGRERRVLEKSQTLEHEIGRLQETQVCERSIYEKEVRRSRKEAFKSSSALVACQDELRAARNRHTLMREEMEAQRRLKDEQEQETTQAQKQTAVLLEEAEELNKRLEIAEREKALLKMTLAKEEVARIASEGSIALPSLPTEDEFASPRKRRRTDRESSLKENVDPERSGLREEDDELQNLKDHLQQERRLRTRAEEEAQFLKMECQFGVCSCRIAEQKGTRYVHDNQLAPQSSVAPRQPSMSPKPQIQPQAPSEPVSMADAEILPALPIDPSIITSPTLDEQSNEERTASNTTVRFSPHSGTFSKQPSPSQTDFPSLRGGSAPGPSTPEKQSSPIVAPATTHGGVHQPHQTPRPLPNPPPRTVSHCTTTTVPLKADDPIFSPAPNTPGGISREEALERIRQRRGRARSFAVGIGGTPGRGSVRAGEREGEGRVISAPVGSKP